MNDDMIDGLHAQVLALKLSTIQEFHKAWGVNPSFSKYTNRIVGTLATMVPLLIKYRLACPVSACKMYENDTLALLIPHLNDLHRWTREAIADWLDTLDIDLTVHPIDKENEDNGDAENHKENSDPWADVPFNKYVWTSWPGIGANQITHSFGGSDI